MDTVERIANTVIYEGYRLFPYSPSAIKNTRPSLFGVVYPEDFNRQDQSAGAHMQTECIMQGTDASELNVTLRFLQLKEMAFAMPDFAEGKDHVQNRDERAFSMHGYHEKKIETGSLRISELETGRNFAIEFEQESKAETLRNATEKPIATCISRLSRLKGSMSVLASRVEGTKDLFKISVRISNTTPLKNLKELDRDSVLRQSFLSTHLILRAQNGEFLSLTEMDGDIKKIAKGCNNVNMWPVLATKENDVMLSSPIILYDYPEIAPESTGDFFDSTEIEEYLLLHIAMLSDEEKEKFSQGDERLRAAFENAKKIGQDEMLKLHGTFRFTRSDAHRKNAINAEQESPE